MALVIPLGENTQPFALGTLMGTVGMLPPARVTAGFEQPGPSPGNRDRPRVSSRWRHGCIGASVLYLIASGTAGFNMAKGFARTAIATIAQGHYSLFAGFLMEVVMTMMFLFIIIDHDMAVRRSASRRLAIGLALALTNLAAIPSPTPGSIRRAAPGPRSLSAAGRWAGSGSFGWRQSSQAPSAAFFTDGCVMRPPAPAVWSEEAAFRAALGTVAADAFERRAVGCCSRWRSGLAHVADARAVPVNRWCRPCS